MARFTAAFRETSPLSLGGLASNLKLRALKVSYLSLVSICYGLRHSKISYPEYWSIFNTVSGEKRGPTSLSCCQETDDVMTEQLLPPE